MSYSQVKRGSKRTIGVKDLSIISVDLVCHRLAVAIPVTFVNNCLAVNISVALVSHCYTICVDLVCQCLAFTLPVPSSPYISQLGVTLSSSHDISRSVWPLPNSLTLYVTLFAIV